MEPELELEIERFFFIVADDLVVENEIKNEIEESYYMLPFLFCSADRGPSTNVRSVFARADDPGRAATVDVRVREGHGEGTRHRSGKQSRALNRPAPPLFCWKHVCAPP